MLSYLQRPNRAGARRCAPALALAGLLAVLAPHELQAETCVPRANGVAGTLLWQQPPNWWDPAPGFPQYNTSLDDPRWRGTFAQTFPVPGTGVPSEHVTFRGLHRDVGGQVYLYLSWHIEVAPSLQLNTTRLYVGFRDPSTPGPDVVIEIRTTTTAPTQAGAQFTPTMRTKPSVGGAWTPVPDPLPSWVTNQTKVWVTTAPNTWAVQMRVPITASADLNNGVNVSSPFRVWYEARVAQPASPTGFIPYSWPTGQQSDPVLGTPPNPVTGMVENWDLFRLTTGTPESPDPACAALTGVSLTSGDIGTTNPVPTEIKLLSTNTFRARPSNSGGAVTGLKARFRIANWGTQPIWETSPTTLWEDIASPTGEPAAGIAIASGAQGTVDYNWTLTQCERCEFNSFYNNPANTAACDALTAAVCGGVAPALGQKRDHQCLLVELSGPGITFLNQSVYRNMDTVQASRFERAAEVNVGGLGPDPGGGPTRDVYLYVETVNMPARVEGGGGASPPAGGEDEPDDDDDDVPVTHDPGGKPPAEPQGDCPCLFDYDPDRQRMATEPTYLVHAYYDTGEHADPLVLRPMTSFGYFINHEGELAGWEHALEGATLQEIAPNFYRVSVPNDGVAEVRTIIEAIEEVSAEPTEDRWSLSFHAGLSEPQGNLDGGSSFGFDIEYALRPAISLELYLGEDDFDSKVPGLDLDVSQASLSGKFYLLPGSTRPFVTVGLGSYDFSPGPSEVGVSFGVGGQFKLWPRAALEARLTYHSVSSSPSFEYLSLLGGVKLFF